jgi:N-acetylmuramoyl-L-alanine amidase
LNVRSEASTDSQVIHKIKQGEKVVILEEDGDWRKIKTNDISGWVAGWLLDETNETTEGTTAEQPALVKGIVTATILNIRDNASLKGKVIGKLKKGESVKISKELDDWSEIQLPNQKKGWVASWYLEKQEENTQTITNPPTLSILNNGTNIRKGPSTSFQVVTRANEGDSFPILNKKGDWYEIELPNNKTAFVAGWIVSVSGNIPKVERKGIEQYFKGKTIVLDPGHGGKDSGAKGYRGTYEKVLTLRTAKLVANKLESAGANVILTRKNDLYASLHYRVSISHYYNADAFLSFHYDSAPVASANGIGTFYYSSKKDKPLASPIHKQLIKNTNMNDRKVRYGNYHVIRENKQPSILLELGFLSNRNDELTVGSNDYQEKTAQSIYTGLAQYFKKN